MNQIIDYDISLIQLQEYTDYELCRLLMYSDRDRKDLIAAENVYWMCIMEINRRNDECPPNYIDVKCICNIFNSDHKILYRLGSRYQIYQIDENIADV